MLTITSYSTPVIVLFCVIVFIPFTAVLLLIVALPHGL
jgi:hypothetical protein